MPGPSYAVREASVIIGLGADDFALIKKKEFGVLLERHF
jgi:hypothetical protein